MAELPKRKPNRLDRHYYSLAGAFFVTICTHNRKPTLSTVGAIHESPETKLTPYGKIVADLIGELPNRFDIKIDQYVIMPNHIHMIVSITQRAEQRALREAPLQARSILAKVIGYLKMNSSKRIHQLGESDKIWQRSYHDHIIRDRHDYRKIAAYVAENPARWHEDCFFAAAHAKSALGGALPF